MVGVDSSSTRTVLIFHREWRCEVERIVKRESRWDLGGCRLVFSPLFFFVALLGERDIAARFFLCDLLQYVVEES